MSAKNKTCFFICDMIISKTKQKGQYDYEKILLSSVALLSLVATLAVNNPVSAQESSSQTTYSKSSGSWIKSGSRWWYKHSDGSYTRNGWEKINETCTILIVKVG